MNNRSPGCPHWCELTHSAGTPTSHETESATVHIGPQNRPQRMAVKTVRYMPDDVSPDEQAGIAPIVEVAHHVDGRYRLINLSGEQARALAAVLLRCAETADAAGSPAPHAPGAV